MGDEGPKLLEVLNGTKSFIGNAGRVEAWITVVVALVVIVSSTWLWLCKRSGRRKRIPGPAIWPVIGSMLDIVQNFDTLNDWYLSYFSDDVKTFAFAIPEFPRSLKFFATVDPVNVEYILTNIHKYGKGPGLQERAGDFLGSGMLMTDGAAWKRHRRIASTEFSTSKLRDHCDTVFREGAIKLANVLKSAMAVKDPVEIQDLAIRLTLDNICKMAFGVELGCLAITLPDVPFARAFDDAQSLVVRRAMNPLFKI